MEKEHKTFLDEKRSIGAKRERIIETLTRERDTLQERLNAIQEGPHARHEAKVSDHWRSECKRMLISHATHLHTLVDALISEMNKNKCLNSIFNGLLFLVFFLIFLFRSRFRTSHGMAFAMIATMYGNLAPMPLHAHAIRHV